jgi:branched-chain amino acid transport system substrate-binding protein
MKQYREIRLKPILLSVAVIWSSPVFLNAAGKTAEGVYIATGPRTTGTAAVEQVSGDFQKIDGHVPLPYELTAYDALMIVLEGMKSAGSTDPTALRDALRKLDYKGVLQQYTFAGKNQSAVDININKITDGRVVPISAIRT